MPNNTFTVVEALNTRCVRASMIIDHMQWGTHSSALHGTAAAACDTVHDNHQIPQIGGRGIVPGSATRCSPAHQLRVSALAFHNVSDYIPTPNSLSTYAAAQVHEYTLKLAVILQCE